jgi:dihydropteroate synthase/2-amino-4-hydroxy-6-hydroxymethyldihydropteridine diphosphokinase
MTRVYLGLGSNLGDRRDNLRTAIGALGDNGSTVAADSGLSVTVQRVSPIIETPALLPDDAPWEWNKPFLNLVIECDVVGSPEALLATIHRIQDSLGRDNTHRWSPRPIDIDILLWGDDIIDTDALTVPHRDMHLRHFVLTPLIALAPDLTIPGRGDNTVLQWSRQLPHHIPLWMGIINVTPDSFSDGGKHHHIDNALTTIEAMINAGCNILDLGAESTRPGADTIGADAEWKRLEPVLTALQSQYQTELFRPKISIDTRNPSVAEKALTVGADIINDVGGLTDPAMISLAAQSSCEWVAMHSLTVPADSAVVMDTDKDPVPELLQWLQRQADTWQQAGINLDRVIFDPGIGFGKDPLQSLKILQRSDQFHQTGFRLLVGHSRKSFMKSFAGSDVHERDMVTIGAAMQLCQQGVDIIRVHNIVDHIYAYRGWAHLAER